MVDFTRFLTPDQNRRLEVQRAEIDRLYDLPDRWLAREILNRARSARQIANEKLGQHALLGGGSYETSLVWGIVPEIAHRLGETTFMPGERPTEFRTLDNEGLRDWTGSVMQHASPRIFPNDAPVVRGFNDWDLLLRTFVNGNPVVMGLDRVAKPNAHSQDWCAKHMREVGRHRGHPGAVEWSPAFQITNPRQHECTESDLTTPLPGC